jgi:hypothetical protein
MIEIDSIILFYKSIDFKQCNDKRFECGDSQLFQKWIANDKNITYFSNADISGDREAFVAKTVANAATDKIGLTPLI